jgi:hypothetical protein
MTRGEVLRLAVYAVIALLCVGLIIRQSASCHNAGGTLVRGVVWLECLQ